MSAPVRNRWIARAMAHTGKNRDIVTKGLAYTKRTFRYSSNKGARGLTRHPIRDYSQDRGGATRSKVA